MVSKFFQRTVLTHLVFIGIGYLLLRAGWMYVVWSYGNPDRVIPAPQLTFVLTFLGAFYYSYRAKKYRPIPGNPIQQLRINLIVGIYAVIVALTLITPFNASFESPDVPFSVILAALYIFCAWRHIYGVDLPVVQDANGRQMTLWQRAIRLAKKQPHLRRSTQQWYHY
jgi:hypothetical protein